MHSQFERTNKGFTQRRTVFGQYYKLGCRCQLLKRHLLLARFVTAWFEAEHAQPWGKPRQWGAAGAPLHPSCSPTFSHIVLCFHALFTLPLSEKQYQASFVLCAVHCIVSVPWKRPLDTRSTAPGSYLIFQPAGAAHYPARNAVSHIDCHYPVTSVTFCAISMSFTVRLIEIPRGRFVRGLQWRLRGYSCTGTLVSASALRTVTYPMRSCRTLQLSWRATASLLVWCF